MKKIYQTPTIKTAVISVESILAGSNVNVYNDDADQNLDVLSRHHGYWDDEEDEY